MLLIVGLLSGGLVSLLLLNTVLAQDAFALDALREETTLLEERQQALRQEVAAAEAPQQLARKARELGMVPAPGTAFVDPKRGAVVGQAVEARARPGVPSSDSAEREERAASGEDTR